jgi:cytoskeletal protein RodZ
MEAFGKKLTEARTARGLDFDQVSRDTNITRRYLEALEKEDFAVFPGEPYLLGFLRNYCDYLGLNANEIITSYKNLKIQESPVPLKELMPRRTLADVILGNPSTLKITGVVAVLIVVVLVGYFAVSRILNPGNAPATVESRTPATYEVSGDNFKQRVYVGDSLNVTTATGAYKMVVQATAPSLKLDTPVGTRVVELGQDLTIDLSGDDIPDVKVFVADLFKNDPSKGADVRISTGDAVAASPAADSTTPVVADASTATDVTVTSANGVSAPAASKQTVLFESGTAYPVTMNATFRGYCLFRYESDRKNRDERYYQKSELLTVQANNGIRIWASNGNSVKLQLVAAGKTVDLEVSRPGEVIVRDLKWVKDDETGRFKFVVMDID